MDSIFIYRQVPEKVAASNCVFCQASFDQASKGVGCDSQLEAWKELNKLGRGRRFKLRIVKESKKLGKGGTLFNSSLSFTG